MHIAIYICLVIELQKMFRKPTVDRVQVSDREESLFYVDRID